MRLGLDRAKNTEYVEDADGLRVLEQTLEIPYKVREQVLAEFWLNWIRMGCPERIPNRIPPQEEK